jgi:hypothetical protein
MRPRRIGSPSTACGAGKCPPRFRIAGSWLGASGRTCSTTKTAAARPRGKPAAIFKSGWTPPLDAPMTMTSSVMGTFLQRSCVARSVARLW